MLGEYEMVPAFQLVRYLSGAVVAFQPDPVLLAVGLTALGAVIAFAVSMIVLTSRTRALEKARDGSMIALISPWIDATQTALAAPGGYVSVIAARDGLQVWISPRSAAPYLDIPWDEITEFRTTQTVPSTSNFRDRTTPTGLRKRPTEH